MPVPVNESVPRTMIRRLFEYKIFRLTLKTGVCLFLVKAVGDLFLTWIHGDHWHLSRRYLVEGYGNGLNPPTTRPYPYEQTASDFQQNRLYNKYHCRLFDNVFSYRFRNYKLYTNHPWRENKHEIDQFMIYTDVYRVFEPIFYKVLQKMNNAGTVIPEGINQKIRQLDQYRLDGLGHLTPEL